jgi:hypothetical protein
VYGNVLFGQSREIFQGVLAQQVVQPVAVVSAVLQERMIN